MGQRTMSHVCILLRNKQELFNLVWKCSLEGSLFVLRPFDSAQDEDGYLDSRLRGNDSVVRIKMSSDFCLLY